MKRVRKVKLRVSEEVAAALALGKVTELRKLSKTLMLELEQRKDWAGLVVALTPNLPAMFHPEFFEWHCFEKFQRCFILRYEPKGHAYVLRFCEAPEDLPPDDENTQGAPPPADGGGSVSQASACAAARPPRRRRPEAMARWARAVSMRAIKRGLEITLEVSRKVKARVERAGDETFRRCDELEQRFFRTTRDARARLRKFVRTWRDDNFDAPLPTADAYLDSRRVVIAPGLTLELQTFVPEQTDWDSFPFGRLLSQEEQALA